MPELYCINFYHLLVWLHLHAGHDHHACEKWQKKKKQKLTTLIMHLSEVLRKPTKFSFYRIWVMENFYFSCEKFYVLTPF